MASTSHDARKDRSPARSSRYFLPIAAAIVLVLLAVSWMFGVFEDDEPLGLGRGIVTDADPVIVTEPADEVVAAPLSSEAQGATRTELGSTPPDGD